MGHRRAPAGLPCHRHWTLASGVLQPDKERGLGGRRKGGLLHGVGELNMMACGKESELTTTRLGYVFEDVSPLIQVLSSSYMIIITKSSCIIFYVYFRSRVTRPRPHMGTPRWYLILLSIGGCEDSSESSIESTQKCLLFSIIWREKSTGSWAFC